MRLPEHRSSTPAICSLLFGLSLVSGCASPGTPRPPSLHLPEPAADLSAERVGDEIHLRWTTSTKSTDGPLNTGAMTAELCLMTSPSVCTPVRRIAVHTGPSEMSESLPAPLLAGPMTLLTYRLELRNAAERSAGLSNPAFAASGSAPPPVTGLHGSASREGALLQWEPRDGADAIELSRTRTVEASPPKGRAAARPVGKDVAEERLRVSESGKGDHPFRLDTGGTLDPTARRGDTYLYTAERVRGITLGGHALEIRSVPSAPFSLAMTDTFAPRTPAELAAITNPSATAPSIDLSWQPNTETDLAGYFVYRSEGGATPTRLSPQAIQVPGFHDETVAAGHRYAYTVTAVDGDGNESAPTAPAIEEVRQP